MSFNGLWKSYILIIFFFFRCTLFTYYSVWQEIIADADVLDLKRLLSYHHWRFAWYNFLDLLDINHEEGFCCAICGKDNSLDTFISDESFVLHWSLVIHHWVHPLNHKKQEDKLLIYAYLFLIFYASFILWFWFPVWFKEFYFRVWAWCNILT